MQLELDVADEKLFLEKVDLERRLCSIFGLFTISISMLRWSTEWRPLLYLGDSGVWLIDGILPIRTGIFDLDKFFRNFSGDVGESSIFSSAEYLVFPSDSFEFDDVQLLGKLLLTDRL